MLTVGIRSALTSRKLAGAAAAAAAAVALAGCGGGGEVNPAASEIEPAAPPVSKATAARRLARAPAALRANAADANRLAGEGADGLKARLAKLRGHPVVINVWASWCGPCREEFPYFAHAVRAHGHEVAFIGVDLSDNRGAAEKFLRKSPPGFASIFDPKSEAGRMLGAGRALPTTYFIGRDGKQLNRKIGAYSDADALQDAVRRHASEDN